MSVENRKVSIVIPAYNEENSIGKILGELQSLDVCSEILVIDDGSADRTAEVAESYKVRVIRHPVNKGYGAALKTGFRNAKEDQILLMDADGQHKVQDIARLMEYSGSYDMVVGARTRKSKITLNRRLAQWVMKVTADYLSGQDIPDLNSGFRIIKKEPVLEYMHILPNGFSFTTTITLAMLMGGYDVKYIPIETETRIGKSKIRAFRDGTNFILLILRTVSLFNPLKVFLPVAVVLMVLGLADLVYEVIYHFNVSSASILLITSSIIIFLFGLLADQISAIRRMNK
jgi:glycosyltransferase involved in cell wall biosynthesis